MADLIQLEQVPKLLIKKTPLLDVRAPVEFSKGAFPNATNIPLLTDSEREAVGIRYRQCGKEAAISLGEELVTPALREQRLNQWRAYFEANPDAVLYCFRGGLRSDIAQRWLNEIGTKVPKIAGGYKAIRQFLTETIEAVSSDDNLIVIAGKTGTGKTHLLNTLANSLDLEGFALHRGSAFGRRAQAQPSQISFENSLAIRLLDLSWKNQQRVAVEDESRTIGSLSVPYTLHQRILQSPVAMLEESFNNRVDTIHLDYIQSNYQDFVQSDPDNAPGLFADSLTAALQKIRRRLGEESYESIDSLMQAALKEQQTDGSIDSHRLWISELLRSYYDPMYEYQMQKKVQRIVFRGNRQELGSWIQGLISTRD